MKYNSTRVGIRSMYLLPFLLTILSLSEAFAQCDLSITETHADPLCAWELNGSITLQITGGEAPYSINSVYGDDTTEDTSITYTDFGSGSYEFSITDANGCVANINVFLEDPESMFVWADGFDATCAEFDDGYVSVLAFGGTAPLTYQWIELNSTQEYVFGVAKGTYTVSVVDAHGCSEQASVTIRQPDPITVSVVPKDATCYGVWDGSAEISVTGGTGPYNYDIWGPSSGLSHSAEGLAPDSYYLNVYDYNGCYGWADPFVISEPGQITVTVSTTDITCFEGYNGTATAIVSGGVAPYSYDWLDYTMGTVADPTALSPSDYYLMVGDANGCYGDSFFSITQPDELIGQVASFLDVSCEGRADGSVTLEATGGTAPYFYNGSVSNTIEDLAQGGHTFEITDANGCTTQASEWISMVLPMDLTAWVTYACPAEIEVMASYGTPGYTYKWSPDGWTRPNVTQVLPGTYTVTVTDARGCQASDVVVVEAVNCGEELALVPTAISPNGDGANDTFRVLASDVSSIQLNVYDISGQPLFSTTDVTTATETGWNGRYQGKDVPAGWYIWTLKGTRADGQPLTPQGGQRGRLVLSR